MSESNATKPVNTRPNVILITIDSLRSDVLSCYGHPGNLTPNLDRIAAEGMLFRQAITAGSWTQAAFPPLLTSTYASMYGGCLGALSSERPALITALRDMGYATAGFSTSPLLSSAYSYDRGFVDFIELEPPNSQTVLQEIKGGQFLLGQPLVHQAARYLGQSLKPAQPYSSASIVNQSVFQWLKRALSPFFLWVHYMDTHWPYHLDEDLSGPTQIAYAWRDVGHMHRINWKNGRLAEHRKRHFESLYESAVRYTDAHIGDFLSFATQTAAMENTVVVLVSDHGEEFMERRHWGHVEINLYDEILKVPLIIKIPEEQGGRVIERQVSTLDIMPTIMELCSCPPPSGMQGSSLVPLWTAGSPLVEEESVAISERHRPESHIVAIRGGGFKMIWDSRSPGAEQLFDLKTDPGEQHNKSADRPEVVKKLRTHLADHLRRIDGSRQAGSVSHPEIDDAVAARLRSLGYIE